MLSIEHLSLLILRLVFGGLMLWNHGLPKLQKLLAGNTSFADPLGMGPEASLYLAVFSEFLCGLFLVLGLFTRWVSIPLLFTMFVAAFIVHWSDPLGDKELAIAYMAVYVVLLLKGGGRYSLDHLIRK